MTDLLHPGGKAAALAALAEAGFPVPQWFVVPADEAVDPGTLGPRVAALGATTFAVRSSARGEDSGEHSFAGQFETFLHVPAAEVARRVAEVRASAAAPRIERYRAERGIAAPPAVHVIVQRMINPRAAGVAFSADPVDGRRAGVVVSAVAGTGERLVGGEADGETWRRAADGSWPERPPAGAAVLTEQDAARVAALAVACEGFFGRPQDIEWALDGEGTLWLLQSRPVTTLGGLPDPDDEFRLWDNSNIAESYGGVTTALTFSFARHAYEHVYREFCRLMRVPARRMRAADHVFPRMLGMVEGRVYYNLLSWYRVLALLPGFSLNRRFMEQMMGVKQGLPAEVTDRIAAEQRSGRLADALALARTLGGLLRSHFTLARQIRGFRRRLDAALAPPPVPHARLTGDQLVADFHTLEGSLLRHWDAPLVNDFLAMIFNGLLRGLCAKWAGNRDGGLANALLADCGEVISAEPPRRIRALAARARAVDGLAATLADPGLPWRHKERALRRDPQLAADYDRYLTDFGDRCLEELKLESPTVRDDPATLLAAIGALASRPQAPATAPAPPPQPALGGPLRRLVFHFVLRHARNCIRERENLRFERTRVFGRVRTIVRELGRRLHADGQLDDPADVFHLELAELLGTWDGTRTAAPVRELAATRRREFERCLAGPPPPDRFATRGPLHRHRRFEAALPPVPAGGPLLHGVGACPGIVRGRVRVVVDPRGARVEPGEILAARQTDPGWVVLFPCAAGLLVERGSVLSHSAIVARELGLPCVVSLPGLLERLPAGTLVEMDGGTGIVRLLAE